MGFRDQKEEGQCFRPGVTKLSGRRTNPMQPVKPFHPAHEAISSMMKKMLKKIAKCVNRKFVDLVESVITYPNKTITF